MKTLSIIPRHLPAGWRVGTSLKICSNYFYCASGKRNSEEEELILLLRPGLDLTGVADPVRGPSE